MAHLIASTIRAQTEQLHKSRELDALGRLSPEDLVSPKNPAPIVITLNVPAPTDSRPAEQPNSAISTTTTPEEEALASREVLALRDSLQQLADTNDRVMAQNIALLADLENAQRAVRELRADKDALASQLRRALLSTPA